MTTPEPHRVGLHETLANRHSTRAFDPAAELDDVILGRLLQAARWQASASNVQPWRLIVGRRGTRTHKRLAESLLHFNQVWAPDAAALILFAADERSSDGGANRWAQYDTGQAAAALTVQAVAEGLVTHQMGGFDVAAIRSAFDLPDQLNPLAIVAVGQKGVITQLPEVLQERELAPRTRLDLAQLVLATD